MGEVRRVYVEKKKDYAVKAKELHASLKQYLDWMSNLFVSLSAMTSRIYPMQVMKKHWLQYLVNHQLTMCMKRHYHLPMGKYLSALSFCQVSSIREQILHSSV